MGRKNKEKVIYVVLHKFWKSVGAISKQFYIPRSPVQTTAYKYKYSKYSEYSDISPVGHGLEDAQTINYRWKMIGFDVQEQPRSHQGSNLPWAGKCWTTMCPWWGQFIITIDWDQERHSSELDWKLLLSTWTNQKSSGKEFDVWTIQNWAVWPQWQEVCLQEWKWHVQA